MIVVTSSPVCDPNSLLAVLCKHSGLTGTILIFRINCLWLAQFPKDWMVSEIHTCYWFSAFICCLLRNSVSSMSLLLSRFVGYAMAFLCQAIGYCIVTSLTLPLWSKHRKMYLRMIYIKFKTSFFYSMQQESKSDLQQVNSSLDSCLIWRLPCLEAEVFMPAALPWSHLVGIYIYKQVHLQMEMITHMQKMIYRRLL